MELPRKDQRCAGSRVWGLDPIDPENPAPLEAVTQFQGIMVMQFPDDAQGRAVVAEMDPPGIFPKKLLKGIVVNGHAVCKHLILHSNSSFLRCIVQKQRL